jgi:hypothetical protein
MSALRSLLILLAVAIPLGGCWYSSSVSGGKDGTADMRKLDEAIATTTPQQATAAMSNKTWRRVMGSGQAVHYSTSDGRDFLWVYGEDRIFHGQWKVDTGRAAGGQTVTRLCFRYPADAINPLSNTPGAEWHCWSAGMVLHYVRERVDGDPLQLASRTRAPFALDPRHQTISQLQARIPR